MRSRGSTARDHLHHAAAGVLHDIREGLEQQILQLPHDLRREARHRWQAIHLPVHGQAGGFQPFAQAVAQVAQHDGQVATGFLHGVDRKLQRVERLLQMFLQRRR